jgi:hypothetical protein
MRKIIHACADRRAAGGTIAITRFWALAGLLLTACLVEQGQASSILYDGVGFNDGNSGLTFGVEFTPGANIDVTMLGVFDGGMDGSGLEVAHDVGLWAQSGQMLARITVDNSATKINDFRFSSIPAISLFAGNTYVIGAYYPTGFAGDKLIATGLNTDPMLGVSNVTHLVGGSELAFPDLTHVDFRISANLIYTQATAVPLPAAVWLFSAGLLVLSANMRRANGRGQTAV